MTRLLYLSADPGVPVLGHKGASIHVRELAGALAATGIAVTVASPRVAFEGDELDAGIRVEAIDAVLPRDHPTVIALRRAVQAQAARVGELAARLRADAVYERFSLFTNAGAKAAVALGVPYVVEVNAPLREEAALFRTLPHPEEAAAIESGVLAAADLIFAVSEEVRNALAELGVSRSKVDVLPNGVDPRKFPPRTGRGRRPLTIGFCGSLKPWHGVEVLVEAFRRALGELDEGSLRLEVVGDGPEARTLDRAALPEGSLVRHGALPHRAARRVMASWDVGVAPYLPLPRFYFSPLKVLEYLATGLCVVASDLGQIRALLRRGEAGVLVPPGDAASLAEALVSLARDPAHARALGERGRAHVLSSHTWTLNAHRVLGALSPRDRAGLAG